MCDCTGGWSGAQCSEAPAGGGGGSAFDASAAPAYNTFDEQSNIVLTRAAAPPPFSIDDACALEATQLFEALAALGQTNAGNLVALVDGNKAVVMARHSLETTASYTLTRDDMPLKIVYRSPSFVDIGANSDVQITLDEQRNLLFIYDEHKSFSETNGELRCKKNSRSITSRR
jgi:hypothetical protein